ncbi:MAG: hypothetical protein GWP36_07875 [Bacteroidetes bacterium]|jgi:hypothetical protein|nr:hypothetical protein [Bacteroidota bacterium]
MSIMDDAIKIWIDAAPGLTRALFCRGDDLVEIWHDALHAPNRIGQVHRVRITQFFPQQNRATARLADGTPISIRIGKQNKVSTGKLVIVTITAAPREDKPWQAIVGPRLVSRHLVLLAGQRGITVSRQLKTPLGDDVKAALALVIAGEPDDGDLALIIRRHAAQSPDLVAECAAMIAVWRGQVKALDAGVSGEATCLFDGGSLADKAQRALPNADIKFVDNAAAATAFDTLYEAAMDEATRTNLMLTGGGQMWVERTHALTAIDLDSGTGDLQTLFDAAPQAIARQVRLRQISGLVAIDIPRAPPARAKDVVMRLEAALADDPRAPEILGKTRGGVLEVRIAHGQANPALYHQDMVAAGALAALRALFWRPQLAMPTLELPQVMADWLGPNGAGSSALMALEAALDRPVRLVVSSDAETATILEQE